MPKKRKVKGGSNTSNNSNTTSSSNSNPRNSSLTTQSRSSSDTNSRRGTRLSARKPKKRISDAYTEDYNLRNSLETSGLTIVDMHADGNCLFRALSDQLFGDCGSRHAQIRSDICDFMEQNQEDFQVFLVLDDEDCEEDEDAKDFDGYLTSMREDGEWGGNLELVAAARLYRRKITVFSATLAAYTIEHGGGKPDGPDLLVSFHDNDHYNSVRDEKISRKAPTAHRKPKQVQLKDVSTLSITSISSAPTQEEELPSSCSSQLENASPDCNDLETKQDVPSAGNATTTHKMVKKSAPCPCGSGLRYKKCCHAREKHASRVGKLRDGLEDKPMEDIEPEVTMKGNFRVLQI